MPDIIFEDSELLVCRKEPGIAVQTARLGQKDMVSILLNYRVEKNEEAEIYIIHRLDQPVEGVMVFAKNRKSAAALSEQVRNKAVDKYYHAVLDAEIEKAEGVLEDWLLKDGKANCSRVVAPKTRDAKAARLSYRILERKEGKSLAEIYLDTGRHHQIRVQMAKAGSPLVGDKKYNPDCISGYLPIGLCSTRISFIHPKTGEQMKFAIEPKGKAFEIFQKEVGCTVPDREADRAAGDVHVLQP